MTFAEDCRKQFVDKMFPKPSPDPAPLVERLVKSIQETGEFTYQFPDYTDEEDFHRRNQLGELVCKEAKRLGYECSCGGIGELSLWACDPIKFRQSLLDKCRSALLHR